MKISNLKRLVWIWVMALFAILFGLMTVISSDSGLLNQIARQIAGIYMPLVIWFNYVAGFAYIGAAIGL
ncbi:MAG: hypothetical protein FOGNACKC_04844 [Anaerolineae bacterium]|nr:hypothetical protein [Anaerolineae bacterium]